MSPGETLMNEFFGSLGALLTAMLLGWYGTFVAPLLTMVAGWIGLTTG